MAGVGASEWRRRLADTDFGSRPIRARLNERLEKEPLAAAVGSKPLRRGLDGRFKLLHCAIDLDEPALQ
jgi:hypothetical protein